MDKILQRYSKDIIEKAGKIQVIITDVDGVLTDGKIIYDNSGMEYKQFFVRDGQIIKYLRDAGIKIGAITGRESQVVINRCNELNFDFHHHGAKDKLKIWDEVINKLGIDEVKVAYIGDDLLDIPLFEKAGLSVAPADAPEYIRDKVNLVLYTDGGKGAFRELGDLVLAAKGKFLK